MNDFVASWIRTLTLLIVGALGTAAVRLGVAIDTPAATALVTAFLTGGWYTIVRTLEHYVDPRWGWLLGLARAPKYPNAIDVPARSITVNIHGPADPAAIGKAIAEATERRR